MKKIILLALTALIMVGCESQDDAAKIEEAKRFNGYNIVVIDSCEYVHHFHRLAHKGNCRFCKERRQKELEELVEQIKKK